MEAVIFTGVQASGKTFFYRERFFETHVRINLDMLKTRHREKLLLQACIEAKQPFVVDNTNPTREDRARYIVPARRADFRVVGYYFRSRIEDCKRRNEERPEGQVVPLVGILGTHKRLQLPEMREGFDGLHYVRIDDKNSFIVEEWSGEV